MSDEEKERDRLFKGWAALKVACRKQHPSGPGGTAMYICGAGGGGSAACQMLRTLHDLIAYLPHDDGPPEWVRHVERLKSVIH